MTLTFIVLFALNFCSFWLFHFVVGSCYSNIHAHVWVPICVVLQSFGKETFEYISQTGKKSRQLFLEKSSISLQHFSKDLVGESFLRYLMIHASSLREFFLWLLTVLATNAHLTCEVHNDDQQWLRRVSKI
jgi:hypothetical protein